KVFGARENDFGWALATSRWRNWQYCRSVGCAGRRIAPSSYARFRGRGKLVSGLSRPAGQRRMRVPPSPPPPGRQAELANAALQAVWRWPALGREARASLSDWAGAPNPV